MSQIHNHKILIVDDSEIDRTILKKILQKIGFNEVQEAVDGQDAEYKVHNATAMNKPFQVLFVDWKMPRLTGVKLLKVLRQESSTKNLVVIMTTGVADPASIREAVEAGVSDYILKPITEEIVKEKIFKKLNLQG